MASMEFQKLYGFKLSTQETIAEQINLAGKETMMLLYSHGLEKQQGFQLDIALLYILTL